MSGAASAAKPREIFHIVLIKPTHYDDHGYPIQWFRSIIPSNSLASVNGLVSDCIDRRVLGEDVDIRLTAIDETNKRVRPKQLIAMIRRDNAKALIGMVGVQSNQFPRAVDLARPFLDAGYPVSVGGFHVSGMIAMLPEMPPDLVAALKMGISFFTGEAETGRMDQVIRDAHAGKLKPVYDYLDDLPDIPGQPIPLLSDKLVKRTTGRFSAFDIGRGCPFQCSFCSIINVHGRKSRFRTADDLERIIRENAKYGTYQFFVSDDNLARNKNWEELFDRLIYLREEEGLKIRLIIQVDTLCHRIPNFIEKAVRAGADQVYVGMENINPENLLAVKKKQNRVGEYREMMLAWKKHPVVLTAGYILGLPADTHESILRDIEIIKRELPLDMIYFTNLTPLPGSEDHKTMHAKGEWMDPDMNKYDLNHRVIHHARMSDREWEDAYREVWRRFYTFEHMTTIMRRLYALGSNKKRATLNRLCWYAFFTRYLSIHPLEGGLIRLKTRTDRRPGFAIENPLTFYPKYWAEVVRGSAVMIGIWLRLRYIRWRIERDPARFDYRDRAIMPPAPEETDEFTQRADRAKAARKARPLPEPVGAAAE